MRAFYSKGFLFLLFSIVTSCSILLRHSRATVNTRQTLVVVCTTTMIADAVRAIAGDKVHVETLMGPGIDPHTYKAREGDVHRMLRADVIFYNGLHLEGRMQGLMTSLERATKTVAVTGAIDRKLLRYLCKDTYDPHVWHDVSLWRKCVKYIAQILMEKDCRNSDYYSQRLRDYDKQLRMLDEYCMRTIAQLPVERRIVVTAHDAFYYCAQRYNFSVAGLQGMSTEAEVTMRDIQDAIELIVAHKIPTIFVESSVSSRAINAVKEGVAAHGFSVVLGKELYSDSLGDKLSGGDTYQTMIYHNIDAIVTGLSA